MVFFSVLFCVVVQHWLGFTSRVLPAHWLSVCLDKLSSCVRAGAALRGFSGAAQYILMPTVAVALIFAIVHLALGWFGYFVLSLMWLWYCLHIPGHKEDQQYSAEKIFHNSGHVVFSRLLWFALFGPVGLALYYFADTARAYLKSKTAVTEELSAVQWVVAAMDWVPVRLLGLTYALVGRFAETFKQVRQSCEAGLDVNQDFALQFAKTALPEADAKSAVALVMRALWVWVVVFAIFSIGMLL